MENLGLEPSPHTYDGLVKAVVSHRGIDDTMELVSCLISYLPGLLLTCDF